VSVTLGDPLVATDDPRSGHEPTWHQTVFTSMRLRIWIPDPAGAYPVEWSGGALFYMVRGDSTQIPQERLAAGEHPSPAVWYLERCEDQPVTAGDPQSETLVQFKRRVLELLGG
jgi:hypothetical protein